MAKVVRVKGTVKNGKVTGVRQTNKKVGLANKLISAVVGKPGKKR